MTMDMEEKLRKDMLDAMMAFYWSPLIEGKERETYTIGHLYIERLGAAYIGNEGGRYYHLNIPIL